MCAGATNLSQGPATHASEPGADVETDRQENCGDGSSILVKLPPELLVMVAEKLGNPLSLLVSKAHLNKAFLEAARDAQGTLKHVDLSSIPSWFVDDAVVGAVVSTCSHLSLLDLCYLQQLTDAAVVAVAAECKQLKELNLRYCEKLTDTAVGAVASGCKQLTVLQLQFCRKITRAALTDAYANCEWSPFGLVSLGYPFRKPSLCIYFP